MALILADAREGNGANPYLEAAIAENNRINSKLTEKMGGGEILFQIKQITVGDYCIFIKDGLKTCLSIIVERKTWKDLSASIKDNRMNSQYKNLDEIGKKFNCVVLYIIEGKMTYTDEHKIANIPFKNLHAKLRHNLLKGIPFIQTKDAQHTAKVLVDFARDSLKMYKKNELVKINNIDEQLELENIEKQGGSNSELDLIPTKEFEIPTDLKTLKVKEDADIILDIWCSIPGISNKSATIIMEKYTLYDIICNTDKILLKKNLSDLKHDSGMRFGDSKADAIMKICHNYTDPEIMKEFQIKILSQIPGITNTTAEIILNTYLLKDICNGFITVDNIADLKTQNKKIGSKNALKILKIFLKPEIKLRIEGLY